MPYRKHWQRTPEDESISAEPYAQRRATHQESVDPDTQAEIDAFVNQMTQKALRDQKRTAKITRDAIKEMQTANDEPATEPTEKPSLIGRFRGR